MYNHSCCSCVTSVSFCVRLDESRNVSGAAYADLYFRTAVDRCRNRTCRPRVNIIRDLNFPDTVVRRTREQDEMQQEIRQELYRRSETIFATESDSRRNIATAMRIQEDDFQPNVSAQ